jgi:hypothetical protein
MNKPTRQPVTLTRETILATRAWFAQNSLDCIADVESGAVTVHNPEQYKRDMLQNHDDHTNGKFDHTYTFRQRAYYMQTGECVSLL